jgi:imidazolonepropionase-like amidohydrolase
LKDAFKFLDGAKAVLPEPPATGVTLSVPAATDFAPGTVALVGGRVITMKGDQVLEDATVVVRDGRITAVGPRGGTPVPKGAQTFDVTGKTLMPGLIDVHWHGPVGEAGFTPQQNWKLLASLAFGVTTIHDPSNDTEEFFAASEAQRSGAIVGPRLFSTGTILYGAQGWFRAPVESLEDARTHLRRLKAVGAFSVKSYSQPRRDQRQKLIQAARELNMMVVPEGGSLLQHNLTQVVDGHTGIEHSVPVARVYEDVLQLWAGTRVGYTPTLGVAYGGLMGENYWYQETDVWKDTRLAAFVPRKALDARSRRRVKVPPEELNHLAEATVAAQLQKRGVSVQLGAHGQREGLAAHWELQMFGQGGMSPLEALRAGTLDGARYLGLDADLGSLEPGKLADLLVLDKNPLERLENAREVRFTMLGGRLYDAATMDERWPRARKRPPLFFERAGEDVWPDQAETSQCAGD